MKRKFLVALLLVPPLTFAQGGSNSSFNLINPDDPNDGSYQATEVDTRHELKAQTESALQNIQKGSFLRMVRNRTSSGSRVERESALNRFNLSEEQADIVIATVNDWAAYMSSLVMTQQVNMCESWNTESANSDEERAEQALAVWASYEPSDEVAKMALAAAMLTIEQQAGKTVRDSLEQHYEARRPGSFSYTAWIDSVRARNNVPLELNSICGGVK